MHRVLALLVFLSLPPAAFAATLSEQQKIETMIEVLANSDVTFIRGEEPHDAVWAGKLMIDKMRNTNPPVQTAEDFIVRVGSVARNTNKPFIIKLKNGKTMEASAWFRDQLSVINAAGG